MTTTSKHQQDMTIVESADMVSVKRSIEKPFQRRVFLYACRCGAEAVGGNMTHHLITEHKWSYEQADAAQSKARRVFAKQ